MKLIGSILAIGSWIYCGGYLFDSHPILAIIGIIIGTIIGFALVKAG